MGSHISEAALVSGLSDAAKHRTQKDLSYTLSLFLWCALDLSYWLGWSGAGKTFFFSFIFFLVAWPWLDFKEQSFRSSV